MTQTPTEVRALLDRFGIEPRRSLGQNFVADPNTVRRIARQADLGPDDAVIEIGAGLGALTRALVDTGARVTAVEVDPQLVRALEEVLSGLDVRLVAGDARRLDWEDLLSGHDRWFLVSNLPYNVATPLVLDLLDSVPAIDRYLVMVQREVGERLAAPAGTAAYGIPSVKVAYHATAAVVGHVSPSVFVPRPRVASALVHLVRRPRPAVDADPQLLFELVRTAFGQRRKMLRRSLAAWADDACFADAGVDPRDRPERLGVEDWGRLTDAVAARR